ncbi:MAG: CDP-alcohol phosphatidyltransferase family protein [Holosporales bacterium]|nr:CDP-alcohol phosphatidyltransferase family protein [Holosporales bacterium]
MPNLATLSAFFVGMTQVKFAMVEKWEFAIIALIAAAFLDAMDGRLARLFNSCSRFGAELDSLSDFAVFGVAPAMVMYLYCLSHLNRLGWILAIFFAICVCLRLARFNTHDIENVKTPFSGKFFTGVPAPAGAILALFPVILFNAFELDFFKNPYFSGVNMVVVGTLCISKLPTPSIKNLHINREQYIPFLLGVIVMIGIIFTYTWKAFSFVIFSYIVSLFFCKRRAKKILNTLLNDQAAANK